MCIHVKQMFRTSRVKPKQLLQFFDWPHSFIIFYSSFRNTEPSSTLHIVLSFLFPFPISDASSLCLFLSLRLIWLSLNLSRRTEPKRKSKGKGEGDEGEGKGKGELPKE